VGIIPPCSNGWGENALSGRDHYGFAISAVPEASAFVLLFVELAGLGLWWWRKHQGFCYRKVRKVDASHCRQDRPFRKSAATVGVAS
jgi:hypothetical protein